MIFNFGREFENELENSVNASSKQIQVSSILDNDVVIVSNLDLSTRKLMLKMFNLVWNTGISLFEYYLIIKKINNKTTCNTDRETCLHPFYLSFITRNSKPKKKSILIVLFSKVKLFLITVANIFVGGPHISALLRTVSFANFHQQKATPQSRNELPLFVDPVHLIICFILLHTFLLWRF